MREGLGGDKEINALISYKQINQTDIYEYVDVQKILIARQTDKFLDSLEAV